MKFQEALKEKNITIQDLGKTLQKKIQELEKQSAYIETLDKEDFDEEEKSHYDSIVQWIKETDEYIFLRILKFNPEVQERRKKTIEKNREKKAKTEETNDEYVSEVVIEEKPKDDIKKNNIAKKLQEIKDSLTIDTKKFNPLPEQDILEPEVEEVEEFEKKADIKPRKGSTAMIVMALGLGILTFGSVMFFKDRR